MDPVEFAQLITRDVAFRSSVIGLFSRHCMAHSDLVVEKIIENCVPQLLVGADATNIEIYPNHIRCPPQVNPRNILKRFAKLGILYEKTLLPKMSMKIFDLEYESVSYSWQHEGQVTLASLGNFCRKKAVYKNFNGSMARLRVIVETWRPDTRPNLTAINTFNKLFFETEGLDCLLDNFLEISIAYCRGSVSTINDSFKPLRIAERYRLTSPQAFRDVAIPEAMDLGIIEKESDPKLVEKGYTHRYVPEASAAYVLGVGNANGCWHL